MGIKNKRGIFFSIDAIIALSIIFLIILLAYPIYSISKTKTEIHYDLLSTLSSIKIGELDNSYSQSLISEGIIVDLNKTVLEQIGEFYVTNLTLATRLTDSIMDGIETNRNIGIWYGSKLISSKNSTSYESAKNIEIAKQTISGIKEGESATGFSARAYFSTNHQTKYFYFGGYVGDGNISSRIDYSGNISSAEMELVINENFDLYVNNNFVGNYEKSESDFTPKNYEIPIQHFTSGINIIELRGESLHIAGGYIKIEFESEANYEQSKRYYFPGINGLINIYDGLYIPNNLTSITAHLHLKTDYKAFFNLGNETLFNNFTNGEQTINIDNSQISSVLNYDLLQNKTIPLRIGLENVSYSLQGTTKIAEIFSVTDLSGSMAGTKFTNAKNANNALIDKILNYSGNRVGLSGYGPIVENTDFHELSNNSASLKNIVNNVWNADGTSTCICCGILKALSCYDTSVFEDNFEDETVGLPPSGWSSVQSGGSVVVTQNALQDSRAVMIIKTSTNSQRPRTSNAVMKQQEPISFEFMIKQYSGTGRAKIILYSTTYYEYVTIKLYDGKIRNIDNPLADYSLNTPYKIRIDLTPGSNTFNLYVNDVQVGANLPVSNVQDNVGYFFFTSETNPQIAYAIDDVKMNLQNPVCDDISPEGKTRAMIVMSDGNANSACSLDDVPDHDSDGSTDNDPQDQAIEAACMAYEKQNITVNAVGFGADTDESTLQKIAQCGNGSYYFGDVGEIVDIYEQIAESIIEASYQEQTLSSAGNVTTILYPDSYIELNYPSSTIPYGLILNLEKKFTNSDYGEFSIPSDSRVLQAETISYSGSRWTYNLNLNGNPIYDLSNYGQSFINLGDPFKISLPNFLIQENNTLNISTAVSSSNISSGSENNKIIYKIMKNITSYSGISASATGCVWNIEFEDNTNITSNVPSDYSGLNNCYYSPYRLEYDNNNAIQSATFNLLRSLDFNLNNKVDLKFSEQDLRISSSEIKGIPFTWDTEVNVRIWD